MKRTVEEYMNEYRKIANDLSIPYRERDAKCVALQEEWYREMDVGDHGHVKVYSDVYPVTVVKKTATTLTVRHDKATRDPNWKPEWIPGGFSAICTNDGDQKWIIEEDPSGDTEVFRWSKRYGCYRNAGGLCLKPGWRKYYDYNF